MVVSFRNLKDFIVISKIGMPYAIRNGRWPAENGNSDCLCRMPLLTVQEESIMKWRIYYNKIFYSDVVAESRDEAVEKVEKVLELEDLFHVYHVEMLEDRTHLKNNLWC